MFTFTQYDCSSFQSHLIRIKQIKIECEIYKVSVNLKAMSKGIHRNNSLSFIFIYDLLIMVY